jgi:uncharacterized protein YyaL (SSP411 family)
MTHTASEHTNRLITETSPYLLQHAHNPVDWYPWGEEALALARREDKPILLSVGYSACHWCHVMAHESFEDTAVAAVMNDLFVCIKVDREERPDLDRIYQLAHQMLAQRPGGWPLTMFLTPDDHTPYFGGTYFPKTSRHGLPAFTDLLQRVAGYYREQRDAVQQQNAAVHDAFRRSLPVAAAADLPLDPVLLDQARSELQQQYDAGHGGFGKAPKFPHPTSIERCLRHWAMAVNNGGNDLTALNMARHSLSAMALGGVYDQLAGGFCRYSVDDYWMIPHFEKMLYDNAQLLPLYADAALALDDPLFRRVALDTAAWVMRDMQATQGGYFSSLDADTEGHEGRFYVWQRDEVKQWLSPEEYAVAAPHYGLDRPPNFENAAWNLHVFQDGDALAQSLHLEPMQIEARLASARRKLNAARALRVAPGRDEKILTAWNGLMIKGMAHAGRLLGRDDCIASAARAVDFLHAQLWRDGRLLATHKDGRSHLNAYLDDYAFLMDGVLELLQARWRDSDMRFLVALTDALLAHYQDPHQGGFYFTADDHEKLIHRPKPAGDEAIPAGNGVAAQVLLRLGHLLGDSRYLDAAERTLKALYQDMARFPSGHNTLLNALEEYHLPAQTVVLRGTQAAMQPWLDRCQQRYAPRRAVLAIPDNATYLPGVLAQRVAKNGVSAYVCAGHTCSAPIGGLAQLDQALRTTEAAVATGG